MKDLFMHCGAVEIDREELESLPLPNPMGSRHVIRPITQDVDLIEDSLKGLGLDIIDQGYAVKMQDTSGKYFRNPDAAPPKVSQVFGLFEIGNKRKDFSVMVGLRGSYDQSLPRGIAVGSRVFVCDNLAFSGSIHMHTKQTLNIDFRIKQFIAQAMYMLPDFIQTQDHIYNSFKAHPLTHHSGENIIIDMFRQGILNTRSLPAVINEWDHPSFNHGEESVWTLFNAITQTYKDEDKFRLNNVWDDSILLTDYLKNYVSQE